MGRWYCCNDSFVSLSTLHEVLSEKVYVLFFSRTNQRTVSVSKAVTSNGVKFHGCNGSEASKSPEIAVPQKPAHAKPNVEQSSRNDVPTISKVGKTPSSLQMKFNCVGNSSSKERPATDNGKVDVHKSQSTIMNWCVKDSVSMISEKDSSSISRIGFGKNRKVTSVHGEKGEESLLANGKIDGIHCVGISLVKPDLGEDTSRRSNVIIVRGTDSINWKIMVLRTSMGYQGIRENCRRDPASCLQMMTCLKKKSKR
ncbi:Ubiquitin carboxyl-terminal hydrolase 25 [Quillaja saponaria]|uniref:Ubiquitin carboxyl-terminal hydrolase 25 n=1 Tax=Quillaja saponaria TaxID=32244 RepID=A0AAD7QI76_QUISA|nr:Ubiquitin carboxyl-terminal hydrolase 25 [Quillaja saponaria]